MNKNIGLKIVGLILLIGGLIAIIIAITGINGIDSQSKYISGDYILRHMKSEGLAQQKIPYYISIGFGITASIVGLILLVIKPRPRVYVSNMPMQNTSFNLDNTSSKNVTCPNCKQPVSINDVFCCTCGFNLKGNVPESTQVQPESFVCPSCKKQNSVGSNFCIHCGSKIR